MTRFSKLTSLLLTSCTFSLSGMANSPAAELVSLSPLTSSAGELAVDIELAHGKSAIGNHPDVYGVTMKACPAGQPASPDCQTGYPGIMLQVDGADHLKLNLKDNQKAADTTIMKHHCMDESSWSLMDGTTNQPLGWLPVSGMANLHTHGLLVKPYKTEGTPNTYGDYVFDCASQITPMGPVQGTDMKIDISMNNDGNPAIDKQPSGLNWFHPHVHGIAKPQVSMGLAGMLSVGSPKDYICLSPLGANGCDQITSDAAYDALVAAGRVRNMLLKDAQVINSGGVDYNWADQEPGFCETTATSLDNKGHCAIDPQFQGNALDASLNVTEGNWVFTVNGQEYPDVTIPPGANEIWRIQNASANITYKLSLRRETLSETNVAGTRLKFQVLNMDGAGVTPGSGVVDTPKTEEILLMPGSRAELLVSYDAANDGCGVTGDVNCPVADTHYQLVTDGFQAGYLPGDADIWPRVALARVNFQSNATAKVAMNSVSAKIRSAAGGTVRAFGAAKPDPAKLAMAVGENCMLPPGGTKEEVAGLMILPQNWKRRVYFGIYANDPIESFVLGNTLVAPNGLEFDTAGQLINTVNKVTLSEVSMDNLASNLCVLKGQKEKWELVNVSKEVHNFHIHQSKFTVDRNQDGSAAMYTPSDIDAQVLPASLLLKSGTTELQHDTIVVPRGRTSCEGSLVPVDPTAAIPRSFYLQPQPINGETCTETAWGRITVNIPFEGKHLQASTNGTTSTHAKFVYHCHILEHEDKGMMASITVLDPAVLQP
jgi:FtsP/CotA-like multicopper oxidase with cupredoxin domain